MPDPAPDTAHPHAPRGDPSPSAAVMPEARIVPARRWFTWAWLAPLAALALAAVLLMQASRERGTLVTIRFQDGAGIRPGDALQHRGVQCGLVRDVDLAPDLTAVLVRVEIDPAAAALAREGSRFWIVKPEVSMTRVRGLETLLGPRYLACLPGAGAPATEFDGLVSAPTTESGATDGLVVIVEAAGRGTIGPDSPVLYRGLRVGAVRGMELSPDGRRVEITAVIDAPFARFVRVNSRFWDSGGLGFDFGLMSGLSFQTGTLETLVAGAIAFATPTRFGEPAPSGQRFPMADKADSEWLQWAPSIPQSQTGTAGATGHASGAKPD